MLEEKRNSTVLRQFWFVDVENTLQVFPVDALYHLCLFRIDDEIPICILGVAEEAEEQLNSLLDQPEELEKKARNTEINYLKSNR